MLSLRASEATEILAHAAEAAPMEACGVLLSAQDGRRWLHRGSNVQNALRSAQPGLPPATLAYTLDPATLRLVRDIRREGGRLLAVYHSHTNGLAEFSRADVRQALNHLGVPHYPGTDHIVAVLGGLLSQPRLIAARWDAGGGRYRSVAVVVDPPMERIEKS